MSANRTAAAGQLRALLEPVIRERGCDLEDLAVTPAGRRRVVRIVVDRDGGLTLDDVAEVSTSVSAALDEIEAMGETSYLLEVSSPGIDRPLRLPRHWRRATSRLVSVSILGAAAVTGRVTSADDDAVELDIGGQNRRYPYSDLGPGAVQVEFGRLVEPATDGLRATPSAAG